MLNETIAKGLDDAAEARKRGRALPILLAAVGAGMGHMFVGFHRRGVIWFAATWLTTGVSLLAFRMLAYSIGGAMALSFLVAPTFLVWLASLIDIARVHPSRYDSFRAAPFVAFVVVLVSLGSAWKLLAQHFVVEAFKIPSASGYPTLVVGDHIFVDKWRYRTREPERGELAVYESPEHPGQLHSHRVLGVPGDEVQFRKNRPIINGWPVPSCPLGKGAIAFETQEGTEMSTKGEVELEFLDGRAYLTFYDDAGSALGLFDEGRYVVREGEYFVVGDNRYNSHDSRTWFMGRGGGAPRDHVKGSAMFVWFNFGPEQGRFGASLVEPTLPSSLAPLAPKFDECMKARPPRDQTVPPRGARTI